MREISATVTVGQGSERHNHNVEYRSTLEHVHGGSEDVIELIPYRNYEEQINEIMKPHIEEYNERIERKYQEAWDRYNNGEIKNKPKKKNYQKMDFEYYQAHKDDVKKNPITGKIEKQPIFRSMILGIGDQEDRKNITREEATRIFENVLKEFQNDFPNFKVLGATIHADEKGFWHMHIDFKTLYEKESVKGLRVGTGLEGALKQMGYEPEQSVINGRDKAPLLFNAMRNQIYREMENAMNQENIRLQYGVSARKDPDKDSSKNQRMEIWQETQDAVRELQHSKNVALEILERDNVTPEELKEAFQATDNITTKLEEIQNSPKSRLNKSKHLVEFRLLDQLKSFIQGLVERISVIIKSRDEYKTKLENLEKKIEGCKIINEVDYAEQMNSHNVEIQKKDQVIKDMTEAIHRLPESSQIELREHYKNITQPQPVCNVTRDNITER